MTPRARVFEWLFDVISFPVVLPLVMVRHTIKYIRQVEVLR